MEPKRFEMFDHPTDVLRYASCPKCGGRINHLGHAEKLDKPDVYGAGTDTPTTFTHRNTVECKEKCTKLVVMGCMRAALSTGCFMRWADDTPPWEGSK